MKISKEVRVGFVAIMAIALLIWSYNYLKGTNLLFKTKTIYTIYPKVPGLAVSSPIIINGVQSGVVEDIYFHANSSSVIVKMNITENELKIPKNSVADLISIDFMGSKAIGLNLGDAKEWLVSGDTIKSHFEKSMMDNMTEQILPIKEKAENLMQSMDSAIVVFRKTMENMNEVFNERNKRTLTLALANLKITIESFDLLSKNLNLTLNNSVKPTMKSYKNLGDSLASLDLKTTLTKAQKTLDNMSEIMKKVNNGNGTMSKLINNDSLYNNLDAVTRSLDSLLIDVKSNPKRYVHFSIFGRKDKKNQN